MPEGDTLRRAAAALRPRMVGKVVVGAQPASIARLRGRRVTSVDANGKHMLMRFEGDLVLHSHMRMTGAWHVYSPGDRWRRPERMARAVLTFDDVVAVLFSAPVVELVRDEQSRVGHLGPDILAEDFEPAAAVRLARLSERAEVGDVLLDQRVCAGIGNIYKCESMWQHRVNPWTPVARMDDEALVQLYSAARRMMRESVVAPGPRHRRAAHGRGGRPCPRCGNGIAVRAQGEMGRLTYYCPRCQGGPSDVPGVAANEVIHA
ncbi:MAG: endonuclease [Chloroflexota bacterium]|jgi:endonuclease-8|nr:endonuclease [Chloroflexota bacterium]